MLPVGVKGDVLIVVYSQGFDVVVRSDAPTPVIIYDFEFDATAE